MTEEELIKTVRDATDQYEKCWAAVKVEQPKFAQVAQQFQQISQVFYTQIAPYVSPWSPYYQQFANQLNQAEQAKNDEYNVISGLWNQLWNAKSTLIKAAQNLQSTQGQEVTTS